MTTGELATTKLTPPVEATRSPAALLAWARSQGVQEVDVKFTDIRGLWQHFSVPFVNFDEDIFSGGIGFDGSSIRGFQDIHESDMNLVPDPDSAFIDPIPAAKTLSLICDVYDISGARYTRDPRGVAQRAEEYLVKSGIADVCYFGPEAEFFIFTSARWGEGMNTSFYEVESNEAPWSTAEGGLAYRNRTKEATSRWRRWTSSRICAPRWWRI
jgi:glutamine synthetase